MLMTRKFLAVGVAAALVCSGCGGSQPTTGSTSADSQHPAPFRTFVEWDATGAINHIPSYKEELATVIQHVANARGEIFAAVIDGQPITTASITARNFGEPLPDGEEPESSTVESAGDGFAYEFIARCTTHEVVRGSGQLQGLLVAARTPGVHEIIMFTDAIINEAGFDLSNATPAELEAEIARWKPKLATLRNKQVTLVGTGRGVGRIVTVERAHRLFHEVVEGNGGHLEWLQTLAQR
jgi:hypothetical protein